MGTLILLYMRKLIVFTCMCAFLCISLHSQTFVPKPAKLSGTVTDEKGKPLGYVSVVIHGLGLSSSTDDKGNFLFTDIKQGICLLTFKRSGYKSKSLEVILTGKDTAIDISLNESLIETGVIDVTGSFNAVDVTKSTFSITELSGRNLTKNRSQTLAETIQNIPGISNVSTGTGIGKPVIRGLSSQSVLIVHDGVKQESQQWGDEHGPELSLFDLDRIEILRGPASLIYGADGIGGVVNVISKPLEFSTKGKTLFFGNAVMGGFSADKQLFGNLTLGIGLKNLSLKIHSGYRNSGDISTPDGTFEVNTLDGIKTITGGKLFNSGSKEFEGGANLGINSKLGIINLGFEMFQRELQIHEDPEEDPEAAPNQKINTNQFSLDGSFNLGKKLTLEPVFSYQVQSRKEFETIADKDNDTEALHLKLGTFDGALKLHHELSKNLSGTAGVAFSSQKNETLAEEKLIPNYHANTYGIFLLEKYSLENFTFSAGARFDSKKLSIESTVFETDSAGNPLRTLQPQELTFNSFTGSFGIAYSPDKAVNLFANIGRGWRPPSEFELFVDGVHEGTGRFERGIKTLDPLAKPLPEESLNIDAGIRINYKAVSIQLSAYRNMVDNFIYPSPTGDTLEGLPVFNILQAKSVFYGYEYSVQIQPVKWVVLSAGGDYVHTENDATKNPLPFSPPMKNIFDVKLQRSEMGKLLNPYIKLGVKVVSAQNNVDPLESKTAGYTLLNGGIGFDFEFAKTIASVDLSVDNIANTKYVDHLSRYKGYALNPGRSFNLQITLPFRVN
jgi:iron complex outermembrane recepter protein